MCERLDLKVLLSNDGKDDDVSDPGWRWSTLWKIVEHVNTSDQPRRQPYWYYHPRVVWLSVIGHSQWLPHGLGTLYRNTFRTRLYFPSSAENWRPFCSGCHSLMPS